MPLPLPYVVDAPDVRGNFDAISLAWPTRGPHCHMARANNGQPIATGGAAVGVAYDTAIENAFGMWSAGANTSIVIPKAGRYAIVAYAEWAANAANVRAIYANISTATQALPRSPGSLVPAAPGGVPTQQTVATSLYLPAAATVQMFAFQNSGGNLNIGGPPATFLGVGTGLIVTWIGE